MTVGTDKAATLDLTLQKTTDLVSQLTSLEMAISLPGTDEQADKLVHQRLSAHDAG